MLADKFPVDVVQERFEKTSATATEVAWMPFFYDDPHVTKTSVDSALTEESLQAAVYSLRGNDYYRTAVWEAQIESADKSLQKIQDLYNLMLTNEPMIDSKYAEILIKETAMNYISGSIA